MGAGETGGQGVAGSNPAIPTNFHDQNCRKIAASQRDRHMKPTDAIKLQKEWGDKPCDHPNIEKEDRILGQWSGDYVCTQCGATGPRKDFQKRSDDPTP